MKWWWSPVLESARCCGIRGIKHFVMWSESVCCCVCPFLGVWLSWVIHTHTHSQGLLGVEAVKQEQWDSDGVTAQRRATNVQKQQRSSHLASVEYSKVWQSTVKKRRAIPPLRSRDPVTWVSCRLLMRRSCSKDTQRCLQACFKGTFRARLLSRLALVKLTATWEMLMRVQAKVGGRRR